MHTVKACNSPKWTRDDWKLGISLLQVRWKHQDLPLCHCNFGWCLWALLKFDTCGVLWYDQKFVSKTLMKYWWNQCVHEKCFSTYCFLIQCNIPMSMENLTQNLWHINFRLGDVPHREGFGWLNHLFKPAKMIEWHCHYWLLEDIVSTRLKLEVLPIPRPLFVRRPLEKELKSLMKVFAGVSILFAWNWPCCVGRLWKMLVEHLLPGSPVLSMEHIFKLCIGVDPGEVALFCPFVKLGDHFYWHLGFNWVLTIILVDLNSTFVLGIVALQLADFRQCLFVIPRCIHLIERWSLVDGCDCVCLVAMCICVSFYMCFSRSSWRCTFDLLESITFHAV